MNSTQTQIIELRKCVAEAREHSEAFRNMSAVGCLCTALSVVADMLSCPSPAAPEQAQREDIKLTGPEDCRGYYSGPECLHAQCPTPGECFQQGGCDEPKSEQAQPPADGGSETAKRLARKTADEWYADCQVCIGEQEVGRLIQTIAAAIDKGMAAQQTQHDNELELMWTAGYDARCALKNMTESEFRKDLARIRSSSPQQGERQHAKVD